MKFIIFGTALFFSLLNANGTEVLQNSSSKINPVKLYAKCINCHGKKGEKSALGKSKIIAKMSKKEIEEALKGYKVGIRNKYGMGGVMKGQAVSLGDDEIKALAEYITKLK